MHCHHSAPVPQFNDFQNKPVTLTIDASSNGLGAAILEEGKSVAYRPCALTPTEHKGARRQKKNCWPQWMTSKGGVRPQTPGTEIGQDSPKCILETTEKALEITEV